MSRTSPRPTPAAKPTPIPTQWQWLYKGFRRYSTRYLRKHFHAVRLSKSSPALPRGDGEPIVFVFNHPGWWDLLVGLMVTPMFDHYRHYVPIDAAMLPKYPVFTKMGFFGIDGTPRGTAHFLRTVAAIFSQSHAALWITAQGEFTDVRKRPVVLRPGVGYVAKRLGKGWIVPVAVEYTFWNERPPEALMRFGEPIPIEDFPTRSREDWTLAIAAGLEAAQDALAVEGMSRDPNLFGVLVAGKTGIGGMYDSLRRGWSWLRGKRFDGSHEGLNESRENGRKVEVMGLDEKK